MPFMKTPRKFNVIAVGRAYTDIVAEVDRAFLDKYSIPLGAQRECGVAELTLIEADLLAKKIYAGGCSANTVAIIAAMGGSAGFFGKVCHDASGEYFLADIKARNIEVCCHPYVENGEMSDTCLVFVTGEHRSFAYNCGCTNNFSYEDFSQFDFNSAEFFLLEAHLLSSLEAKLALEKALEFAKDKCRTVINLHGILDWKKNLETARLIASSANIIVGNSIEQAAFSDALPNFSLTPMQMLVTTHGKDGAEIVTANNHLHAPAITPKTFSKKPALVQALGVHSKFSALDNRLVFLRVNFKFSIILKIIRKLQQLIT
jgi:sugar/nucleoside kinase (ribokinase family)